MTEQAQHPELPGRPTSEPDTTAGLTSAALRQMIYVVELTLTCSADRHVLARFRRLAPGGAVEPAGRVLFDGKATSEWSDGRGHLLQQVGGGAVLQVDDERSVPRSLNAVCVKCHGRTARPGLRGVPNTEASWSTLVAIADRVQQQGLATLRVPLRSNLLSLLRS